MGREIFVSRRWAFGVAYAIGFIAVALLLIVVVQNSRQNDAEARQRAEITRQFCTAIPNVASRTAQALVDVVVANGRLHHAPAAQIKETQALGRVYVKRARVLSLRDLPACQKIKEAP